MPRRPPFAPGPPASPAAEPDGPAATPEGLAAERDAARAEAAALRAEAERYRAFFGLSTEGVWRYELEEPVPVDLPADEQLDVFYRAGYLAECNDAFARMYGFDGPGALVGSRLGDLLPRSDARNEAYLRAWIAAGYRLADAESHEADAEGRPHVFANTLVGQVEDGPDGVRRLLRAWGTQRDVTAQWQAADALTASEARFRGLFDAMPQIAFTLGADGGGAAFNRRWFAYTGDDPATTSTDRRRGYFHPDDLAGAEDAWARALAEGAPVEVEYRLRRADGSFRWHLARIVPVLDADGRVARWLGTATDIHAQKAAEVELAARVAERTADLARTNRRLERARRELADAHRRLRAILDATADQISAVDVDHRLLAFNEAYAASFERYVGRRPDLGDDLRETTAAVPAYRAKSGARWARALGGGPYAVLDEVHEPDGTRRYFDSSFNPIHDEDGRVVGAVQVRRDVTGLKDAEAALREANAALEARNRELQEFAHVASHDLQEPLRKVRAFAALVRTDYADALPADAAGYLGRIDAAAERMSRLIHDLLALSRVGTRTERFRPVDLRRALADALADLDVRLVETGGRVDVAGELPAVEADPVQVRQLLTNLIGNALKFHRAGVAPVVTVSGGAGPAGGVVVTVEDNGVGFDPKYAERIFGPFQRLHGATAYEGTGVGLTIVRRIAERHGGTVTAEGVPGRGARFTVTFPRRTAPR